MAAQSALLRKLTDLAFDEAAEARWQEPRPMEGDNIAKSAIYSLTEEWPLPTLMYYLAVNYVRNKAFFFLAKADNDARSQKRDLS
jgi:hypothetical protein